MNLLADYLEFQSGNEVNENYHIWSAISALSALVSRRIWVNQGYFKIFGNLYVVLLGPPGNGKTTAMGWMPSTSFCHARCSLGASGE